MIKAARAPKRAIAGFLSIAPRSRAFSTVSAVCRPMSRIPDGLTVALDPIARAPAAAKPFTMGGIHVETLVMGARRNATRGNFKRNLAPMSAGESRRDAQI